jgi:hypothetical protein
METRYRVRGGGVDAEIGRQAAEALRAAVGRLHGSVAEILVMLDDEVRADADAKSAAGPRAGAERVHAMTVRIDFLSGGRLIIEQGAQAGEAREDWARIIPRMAERAAVGVRRELERRWERVAM